MKKKILLLLFLFQMTVSFGQEKDEVGHLVGPWTTWSAHSCYKGLHWRIRRVYYGEVNGKFINEFQIQSKYSKKVSFSFRFTADNETNSVSRKTLAPNEMFSNSVLQNETRSIRLYATDLCFEYYNSNGTILENCSSEPDIYKKDYYYAECDNGTPNYKKYSGEKNSDADNTTNPNNTSAQANTFKDLQQEVSGLMNEKFELCRQLNENSGRCTEGYKGNIVLPLSETELKQWKIGLSAEISVLKNSLNTNDTEAERLNQEADQQQKERDAKKGQFDSAIQIGDTAMSTKQYDSAMMYYNQAKNYAQSTDESALAESKYNKAFETKKTEEREERVDKQKQKDKDENLQYAGMAAGVGGAMSLINDGYSPNWYAMKFQLGLGYESLPIISNNVSQYHTNQSYIETFGLPTFHVGFKLGFFNNRGISFHLNPQFDLGFSALSAGTSGGYVGYGSMATVYFGRKSYSKFKVFAEGGYYKKDGTFSYDADAAATGESATDDVREGTFNYGVVKYGGGFMFHWIDHGEETYIRPAAYLETASFFESDTKPVLNLNLQVNLWSEIIFEFNYAKNYFIGGETKYPTTLVNENKDFFSIKIIRQGKLF